MLSTCHDTIRLRAHAHVVHGVTRVIAQERVLFTASSYVPSRSSMSLAVMKLVDCRIVHAGNVNPRSKRTYTSLSSKVALCHLHPFITVISAILRRRNIPNPGIHAALCTYYGGVLFTSDQPIKLVQKRSGVLSLALSIISLSPCVLSQKTESGQSRRWITKEVYYSHLTTQSKWYKAE